jgi:outer membrane protein TolC
LREVRALQVEWESGRARLRRFDSELIPLATERTRASLAGYQGGKTSLTDLLLARRNETEVRLQAEQLEMETARAWAQLNFLVAQGGAK